MDYSPRLLRHSHLTDHTRIPGGDTCQSPDKREPCTPTSLSTRNSIAPLYHRFTPESSSSLTPPHWPVSTSTPLAPATKSSVLSRSYAATFSSPTRRSRNSGRPSTVPPPYRRRSRSLGPRLLQRNSPRREGLALECPALRHPPAGPLHRPDYEDSRAHHRHRFHQRGPPRR